VPVRGFGQSAGDLYEAAARWGMMTET
jgi:hypothetical protein